MFDNYELKVAVERYSSRPKRIQSHYTNQTQTTQTGITIPNLNLAYVNFIKDLPVDAIPRDSDAIVQ